MYRKILWVVLAVVMVACAALSVNNEDYDDNEFKMQGERKGKICKLCIPMHYIQLTAGRDVVLITIPVGRTTVLIGCYCL